MGSWEYQGAVGLGGLRSSLGLLVSNSQLLEPSEEQHRA